MKGMKIGSKLKTTGNARMEIGSVSKKLGTVPGLPGLKGNHEAMGAKKQPRRKPMGGC